MSRASSRAVDRQVDAFGVAVLAATPACGVVSCVFVAAAGSDNSDDDTDVDCDADDGNNSACSRSDEAGVVVVGGAGADDEDRAVANVVAQQVWSPTSSFVLLRPPSSSSSSSAPSSSSSGCCCFASRSSQLFSTQHLATLHRHAPSPSWPITSQQLISASPSLLLSSFSPLFRLPALSVSSGITAEATRRLRFLGALLLALLLLSLLLLLLSLLPRPFVRVLSRGATQHMLRAAPAVVEVASVAVSVAGAHLHLHTHRVARSPLVSALATVGHDKAKL